MLHMLMRVKSVMEASNDVMLMRVKSVMEARNDAMLMRVKSVMEASNDVMFEECMKQKGFIVIYLELTIEVYYNQRLKTSSPSFLSPSPCVKYKW